MTDSVVLSDSLIDRRNHDFDGRAGADLLLGRVAALGKTVEQRLVALPEKVSKFTGHMTELRAQGPAGFGTAASFEASDPPDDADYIARAKAFVTSVAPALGFEAGEPAEFHADPTVTRTSGELRVVSLQQTLNGVEVWGMAPKVVLLADGSVDRVMGDTASVPANTSTMPGVSAEAALRVAVAEAAKEREWRSNLGEIERLEPLNVPDDPSTFARTSYQPRADQPITFAKGPFEEDIPGRLVFLYMGGDIRLAWHFVITREGFAAQYHTFVEADARTANPNEPEILYMFNAASHAVGGKVFRHNPDDTPFSVAPFPLPAAEYPVELPQGMPVGFPLPWTEPINGSISTEGNNVVAVNGSTGQVYSVPAAGGGGVFDPGENSPEQFVTNIFFFCNFMHDFFMMLGFTEESGNFQKINVTGKGKGADPVRAFAHPQPVTGTANMATRADGVAGVMNMGLVRQSGRHTANDADVVFHEFTHGVTNRLVGGMLDAQGLGEPQSKGMGEGWGDYFALTIRNFSRNPERVVTGTWVTRRPEGIRQRPYDENYPGTFGDIGKGEGDVAGDGDLSYQEVHNVGEIWCAALMQMTRNLAAELGKERGYRIAWQAVVDGLKLTPKNPTFLVARDAILRALRAMAGRQLSNQEYGLARHAAWKAFARFGMGVDAFCPNASFFGCQGGTALPAEDSED